MIEKQYLGYDIKLPKELSLPDNFYIHPDALEVFLEHFAGPLDLLLFLIRKQNLDINTFSVSEVTEQYVGYVNKMQQINLDLAGEYLLMSAILTEIKSRILLPKNDDEQDDISAEDIVKQLKLYEMVQKNAHQINTLPRVERDFLDAKISHTRSVHTANIEVDLSMLQQAFENVLNAIDFKKDIRISDESIFVEDKIKLFEQKINKKQQPFENFLDKKEGRLGVVVCFLAILELLKANKIRLIQNQSFSTIYLTQI